MSAVPPQLQKLEQVLEADGGLYTVDDVVGLISEGKLQSFVDGDNWVVTRIFDTNQKRVMEIVFVYGELDALRKLEPEIVEFARDHKCDVIGAVARPGFEKFMTEGWERVSVNYRKELPRGI